LARIYAAAGLIAAISICVCAPASAESVMKMCGAKWQAAKAAGTTGGKSWTDFLAQCRSEPDSAAPEPAATAPSAATPAAAPAATEPAVVKASATTAGATGEHSRIHECSAQWKAAKAANTTNGLKWPQFWHQCDVQLKAEGK
jgi:hypothetical protein